MTKECEQIHALLSLYLEEDLSARDRLRVARHLNDCASARGELEDYRLQRRSLLALPEPEPPAGLHDRILTHVLGGPTVVDSSASSSSVRPWWSRPGVWGLAAAGLGVALFLSLFSDWHTVMRVTRKPVLASMEEPSDENRESSIKDIPLEDVAPEDGSEEQAAVPPPAVRQAAAPRPAARRAVNPNIRGVALGNASASKKTASRAKAPSGSAPLAFKDETAPAKAPEPTAADRASVTLEKALQEPETFADAGGSEESTGETKLMSLSGKRAAAGVAIEPQGKLQAAFVEDESPRRWSGQDGPYGQEHTEVVADPISLMAYWQLLMPGDPMPPVDFKKESVAVLFLGQRPTAGYSILMEGVQEGDKAVTLLWREETPPPDAVAAQTLTRPWMLQVIPRTTKQVLFLKKP